MKKLPFAGLAFLGTAALTFCMWRTLSPTVAEANPVAAPPVAVKSAKNALPKITARAVKLDETARMLEMKMWKFDVQLPKNKRSCLLALELREKGRMTQEIAMLGQSKNMPEPVNGRLQIFIGTYPQTGANHESEQAKYVFRVDTYSTPKGGAIMERSVSKLAPNAFRGMAEMTFGGEPSEDGSVLLMAGNRTNIEGALKSPADVELVFVVRDLH